MKWLTVNTQPTESSKRLIFRILLKLIQSHIFKAIMTLEQNVLKQCMSISLFYASCQNLFKYYI